MNGPETLTRSQNARTATWLAGLALGMFGFGYALIPLYDALCSLTGLNGTTRRLDAASVAETEVDTSRTITVQFLSNTNGLPWDFRPDQASVDVHPGATTPVTFYARNRARAAMSGTAVHSVSPSEGARFFVKTECFCFGQQTLQAGEEQHMPVRFIVSRRLPHTVTTMTLSYTFFRTPAVTSVRMDTPFNAFSLLFKPKLPTLPACTLGPVVSIEAET